MFETKVSVVLIFLEALILTIRVEIGIKIYSQESTSSEWDTVNEIVFVCLFEFSYEERGFPTIPLIRMQPAFQTGLAVANRTSGVFSTGSLIQQFTGESGTHWARLNPLFLENSLGG